MPPERLYGGASPPDIYDDPDAAARNERLAAHREAERAYERAMTEHERRRLRLRDRDGMRCDPHPHDAAPRPPAGPVDQLEQELDPTGRRRYLADTSPHVLMHVSCTAPGCDEHGTYYGREDRLDRIREAGGPRCANHPLEHGAVDGVLDQQTARRQQDQEARRAERANRRTQRRT